MKGILKIQSLNPSKLYIIYLLKTPNIIDTCPDYLIQLFWYHLFIRILHEQLQLPELCDNIFFFLTLVLIIYKKSQIWTLSKGGNDTTSNYSTNKPHPKTTRNLDLSKLQPQDNQDYKNLLSFTNNSKSQQGGPEAT